MTLFLQQLINGLSLGAIYALIALGYTMVYGTLQLINFAHGEVYMMGAFAALYLARFLGVDTNPTIPGVIVVAVGAMTFCAVLGMTIERVAYRPLRRSSRLNMLITAIGVSLLLQNVGLLAFGALQSFPSLLPEAKWQIADGLALRSQDVLTFSVTIALMLGLHHIVERTQIGRAMRAVSHSRDTAALMGIPVDRVVSFTFAIGSVLAGAAALLIALDKHTIRPDMGMTGGLKAFVAAVLGGIGSIPGAVAGGLLLGLAETFVSGYLASTYRDAIAFLLLIGILLYKPSGLFGKSTVEKV
ncbi:MAG: branched-chain amino acid ABC transporter permease [Pseudomonadota bacterium]|nr:branched-chain amino acid ABC transporter permease [Pseudomonadota bacterium]